MKISYEKKPKQMPSHLGNHDGIHTRESGTVWRVLASDSDEFLVDDLILFLSTQYRGSAIINLRSNVVHSRNITEGHKVSIVQDFTVKNVTLYVDNSAMP